MAAVQRVPARGGPETAGEEGREQAAEGEARLTRRAAHAVALLCAGVVGCAGPQLDIPTGPPPRPLSTIPPAPASTQPPQAQPTVLPAAHFQPEQPPKADAPEKKPGSEPPEPPRKSPPLQGVAASTGGPLALDEVLTSVSRHYPLLRVVEQERAVAGGRLVSATGAFDLTLAAGADGQGTTYESVRNTFGVSQMLPAGGVGVSAGYRYGFGEFPTYNLGQKTADGGEFRVGVSVPLLRDRDIDRPRANLRQARLDVQLAEPLIERQRLDFQRAASRTYWNWVAAGQRVRLAESLVKLAADRDGQLKARVEVGPAANIERVDNQQNIALRNGLQVQAERAFQQATIELSLFLRDAGGAPTLAGADRLPTFPPVQAVDATAFDAALRAAFEARPEPVRLRLQREKVEVELRLAANQTLPALNAVVAASQDVGYGKSSLSGPNGLDSTTLSAGVSFQLPVQRRDARGRMMLAQAQISQIDQQLRLTEDVIRAEVQDTLSALERAAEFYKQAKKRVELARLVAEAERQLLLGGRSDVLRVTLREQATFDAEVLEVGAQQEYFRALADFRAALGDGGKE